MSLNILLARCFEWMPLIHYGLQEVRDTERNLVPWKKPAWTKDHALFKALLQLNAKGRRDSSQMYTKSLIEYPIGHPPLIDESLMRRAFAAGFDSSWSKKPPTCRQLYNTLHTACANEAAPMRKKNLSIVWPRVMSKQIRLVTTAVNANSSWVIVDRGAASTTTRGSVQSMLYTLRWGRGPRHPAPKRRIAPKGCEWFCVHFCTFILWKLQLVCNPSRNLSRTMSDTERTFIAVKPDGVQRGLVGDIIKRFEQKGFKLVAMKMTTVSPWVLL